MHRKFTVIKYSCTAVPQSPYPKQGAKGVFPQEKPPSTTSERVYTLWSPSEFMEDGRERYFNHPGENGKKVPE